MSVCDGRPKRAAELAEARAEVAVALKKRCQLTKSGLTHRQLAKLVGTTASATCRMNNADDEGHSLAMLNRLAKALDKRVEIRFLPIK